MDAIDTLNPIHRIGVEQFHRMIASGLFRDGDRVELIDGEMRDMSPIGPGHGDCTDKLTMLFARNLASKAIVRVQGALVLDEGTELYPDLCVIRMRDDWYCESHPTGDDTLLVVEIADSSLYMDVNLKLAKYARAGIRRYWIVDLKQGCIRDYRDPDILGRRYGKLDELTEGELALTIAGVDLRIDVGELLPSRRG